MAEIKIEKKKAIWPWIVGIIILALLIYFLAFNNRNETTTDENAAEELTSVSISYDTTPFVVEVA